MHVYHSIKNHVKTIGLVKSCLLLYGVYLTFSVLYQLSPYGNLDVIEDARDPISIIEARKKFNELNLLKKSIVIMMGFGLYVPLDALPKEFARFLRDIVFNELIIPFCHFLYKLPSLIWNKVIYPSCEWVWYAVIYPFCIFIKDTLIWIKDCICTIPRIIYDVLQPIGRFLRWIWLSVIYPSCEWVWQSVIYPFCEWVWQSVIYPFCEWVWLKIISALTWIKDCIYTVFKRIILFIIEDVPILLGRAHKAFWRYFILFIECTFGTMGDIVQVFIDYILIPLGKGISFLWNDLIKPFGQWIWLRINEIGQLCIQLWELSKRMFYYVYTPVKEWVLDKLYKLWSIICASYHFIINTGYECYSFFFNLFYAFKDWCYDQWISCKDWCSSKLWIGQMYQSMKDNAKDMYNTIHDTWTEFRSRKNVM